MTCFASQLAFLCLCGFWNTGAATPENCFHEIYGYSGHIISLNYPEPYPSGRNCTWIISTFSMYQIQLTFSAFDLEYHESCENDHLIAYDGSSTEDKVLGKFCGSSVPYPLVSSKNIVRIHFYSDSRDQAGGFNITYDSATCGSNFHQLEGRFVSPNYPDNYLGYKRCFWSIEVPHDLQVSLNLNTLQLSNSSDCSTDFIKIFSWTTHGNELSGQTTLDTTTAVPLASICNKGDVLEQKTTIRNLRSVSNKLFIIYESSSLIQNLHFKASFSSVPCGGVYKQDEGVIGVIYPENDAKNADCSWIIEVAEEYQVVLHSTELSIYDSFNCTTDYLEIRDGLNDSSPLLVDRVCGTEMPNMVFSNSNVMWIRLKSDASSTARRFIAKFAKDRNECESGEHLCDHACLNTLSGYNCSCDDGYILNNDSHTCSDENECSNDKHTCGHTCINRIRGYDCSCRNGFTLNDDNRTCSANCFYHLNSTSGTITSSNYPSAYSSNENCVWLLSTIPGYRIRIVFDDFKVEYHRLCLHDSVSVYDGDDLSTSPRLGHFCGYKTPSTVVATGHNMLMTFRTDSAFQWTGFKVRYFAASCFHRVAALNGTIQSSHYPNAYSSTEDCIWHIAMAPGHKIKLEFMDFKVEYHRNCEHDSVSVYDGDNIATAPLLGRFCGIEIPPIQLSTGPNMLLAFRSDSTVQWEGFRVRHFVCGGNITATPSGQRLYSHVDFNKGNYDDHLECDWLLSTSSGHVLQLNFQSFDLERHDSCSFDYVEIFEGSNSSAPTIAKFCGTQIPTPVQSRGSQVFLRFHTDSSNTGKGFALDIYEIP